MIHVTIKTLDAQNHDFTVPSDYTVEQLKEHIAETIQIPSEAQRCIYLGQVLQNDTKLAECDVHGKVIHVVQRAPPSTAYTNGSQNNNDATAGAPPGIRRHEAPTGTMYLGAMAFPSDFMETGGLSYLQARTSLSVSRLIVARNLLRRAINIINQLENENYFSSNQGQSNQPESHSTNSTLGEDIAVNSNGVEQPDVEIRIELSNSQNDSMADGIVGPDDVEIPDAGLPSGSVLTDPPLAEETTSTENTSNIQAEEESSASGSTNREDNNRRRNPRTPMMATVMGAVLHAQVRLIPFMRLLRQYLLQDTAFGPNVNTTHTEQQVQSLYNSVSELMHYFSHIYHSLSDIMCNFSHPPPRTLMCRPVILQQHATALRSGSGGRPTIIRSPVLAMSRSTSTVPSAGTETTENLTADVSVTRTSERDGIHRDAGPSSIEVVIEEADTTNTQDNHEEAATENMDTSEPLVTTEEENGSSNSGASSNAGAPTLTVRGPNGNTYFIQSMPDRVVREGIRINSVEATILTPNEDIATALASGTNQNWRAGVLPAEVVQNVFGFINQFRHSHRSHRGVANERSRQPNSGNAADNNQRSASSGGSETSQPQNGTTNNANERSVDFDIPGFSRSFDPFLPCHSRHIHPIVARASNSRNTVGARFAHFQSATASASSPQAQPTNSQTNSPEQQQPSQESQNQQSAAENQPQNLQEESRRNENEEFLNIPGIPSHVSSLFNDVFPSINIGNVMIRRGSIDSNNLTAESDSNNQGPQPARARIQVNFVDTGDSSSQGSQTARARARTQLTPNMNAIFPGAIQIEIEPLTGNIQTNVAQGTNATQSEVRTTSRRARTASKRSRRTNTNRNVDANEGQPLPMSSSASTLSTSAVSSVSFLASSSDEELSFSLSSTSSDEEPVDRDERRMKEQTELKPSKIIKNLFWLMKKENIRHLKGKNTETERRIVASNYPLYVENQEALFLDIVNTVVNVTSFQEVFRGGEINVSELTSMIRQKLRNYLIQHQNFISGGRNSLLDAVNIFINNDLFKMRNFLDSDSVKQNIDLLSTICKFNHDSVPELIECIIRSEGFSDAELKKFCKIFHFYVARLLTLFVHCISGDDKSVHIKNVLGPIIEEIIKDLPEDEELIRWLRKDLINHVISYSKISGSDYLPSFMSHYLVYRLPPVVPTECTVATAMVSTISDGDVPTPEIQPMEVDEGVQSSSSASSEVSFVSLNSDDAQTTIEQRAISSVTNDESQPSILPLAPPTDPLPEVVLNTEEWHRSFPSEWVPIIARDIHKLRRQGSQPPFSDAYLSGMPTKRRKLIKKNKPDLEQGDKMINGDIAAAVDAAGFSASVNTFANNVSGNDANAETLTEIVKEELKESVRENIVQQSDFLPRRFPNSAKYFLDK